jgi:hypothetical protein
MVVVWVSFKRLFMVICNYPKRIVNKRSFWAITKSLLFLIQKPPKKGNQNNFKTKNECESECGLSQVAGEFNIFEIL